MDLEGLVERSRGGDLDAFAEVTRRFQQMAFGYALALLRDLPQAEDVVQEAFVAAWFGLSTLADPAAFPGWFRGIVRHQAHRLLRQKHLDALPLSDALAVATELAVNETSAAKARSDADWDARGDAINDEIDATWAALPMTEVRERFATIPGQLRGYLTVVPETRWLKHTEHQTFFHDETTAHYEEHRPDLDAILAAAAT